jgi:hypothetical protein
MADQADIYVKNESTKGDLSVITYDPLGDPDPNGPVTVSNPGSTESFPLNTSGYLLEITAPGGKNARDFSIKMKPDCDAGLECTWLRTQWKIRTIDIVSDPCIPTTVNVTIGDN